MRPVPEARLHRVLGMSQYRELYWKQLMDGIQFMEEIGGPDPEEYVELLKALIAECQGRVENAKDRTLEGVIRFWEKWGFSEEMPGGGCTAMVRKFPGGGSWMVTEKDDAAIPSTLEDGVFAAFYSEDGELVDGSECLEQNSEDALAAILAYEFQKVLKSWLTPEQWEEMCKRNAAETDPLICHSHDFCDANEAMHEAFMLFGVDPTDGPASEQEPRYAIWGVAWAYKFKNYLGGYKGL